MDATQLSWYLESPYVTVIKKWQANHDGAVRDHYLLKSVREGAWGNVAFTDTYVTLADGKTYSSMHLLLNHGVDTKTMVCCRAR